MSRSPADDGAPRRSATTRRALTVVPLLATAFLASCGDEERAYCVDNTDRVVDETYCDDDYHGAGTGHFWVYPGGRTLRPGDRAYASDPHRAASFTAVSASRSGGFGSSGAGRTVDSGGIRIGGVHIGGFGG